MTDIAENPAAFNNAMAFLSRGYSVLPLHSVYKNGDGARVCTCGSSACTSPGKHPLAELAPHGLKDATRDAETLKAWHEKFNWLNFGVCTGALVVVDIDGPDGLATLGRLEKQHGTLPVTWKVSTGREGGRHVFFAADSEMRNAKLGKCLDLRGAGGYVVIAGSRHVSGFPYTWWEKGHPRNTRLAPLPKWIADSRAVAQGSIPLARPVEDFRQMAAGDIGEGERHSKILSIAGHLLANCIDPVVAFELLSGFNRGRCKPPLPTAQVERIVADIAANELHKRVLK